MDEENFNEALYLYNAVIEYIYFLIALIEAEGPKDLNNVEKHLTFFNHDIYGFANIFNGEDLAEKIGTMLCATTPIFYVKERLLNLSFNDEYFKRTIYKDLLISKIVDSVLRGMCCIKDICHNLNLNSVIRIEEKSLSVILKKYPYFYLDSNNSVIIRQFHGLLGFEDHAYKTVVQYFQSCLQNNVLTYSEVILHENCIPTCAISNPLFLFCALHVCSIFKCEKGKVKLRKKFRKKRYGNQIINIEKLSINLSETVPIGLLVSKALGRTLYNWTGEISELTKSTGQIQCVVNFSNEYQGIFVIYMYKTALKHICETEDLNNYLSIRDIVEFDAIYCDEAVDKHIFWQATRIKVIKQSLKKNKFELDVDVEMYFEKIKLNSNSFNITSKTCNLRNCNAKFLVLEKNPNIKPNIISKNKANAKFYSDLDTKLSSKLQSTISEKSSHLSQDSSDCLINKAVTTTNQSLPLKGSKEESLCVSKDVHDINLSAVKKDSNQNNVLISNLLFVHSSFVFGEVSVTSEDDGIAVTMNTLNQFNVFFKSEAIFSENTKRIPAKGSIVLLFIPYFESEDSSCVATLVYPLNSEESVLFKENISIESFVMDNFFPIVQKSLGDIYSCFCGLAHILTQRLLISQKFETKGKKLCKTFDFIKRLQEAFCFSEKSLTLFYMLINELYSQNLGASCSKLCVDLAFIFVQAFSFTNCSKKLKVLSKRRKTLSNHSHKRNHSSSHFLSYIKTICSKTSDAVIGSFKEEMNLSLLPKSLIKEEILIENKDSCLSEKTGDARSDIALLQVKPSAEQGHGSCISINSYKSCNSKSSDDVFYSCESDSDSEKNENSMPSQSNSIHFFKENDCKEAAINCNEVNDSLSLTENSSDSFNGAKDIPKITLSTLSKKCTEKSEFADSLDFKWSHSSLSKAKNRRKKHKIILPSSSNHCKECWNPVIETSAYISTITNSCLYFYAKYNQQTATLVFPRYLVSEEMLKSLSLGSSVKLGIIPNISLHFSDVLYINLC